MNERLTIQDFTDLLASKHNMTKKDAEAFVKEFFLLIEQALENEKYIKIKGLGTFKLINVDNKESVNVNTGERFKIQGHSKISFTPDTNLKEVINKPFAHFETVVLNENTLLEDTPTDEIAAEEEDIEEENLADVENYPKEEQVNTENLVTETIPAEEDNHKEMKKE
ncbi:HU family DNA-binding protein, partial [Bacteroides pyogenes]|uniref:HU family DNA-binding protein n=1 Tax=Bacteroides pyogenes TaxID=310300 RepID=UPI002FD9DBED